MNKKLIENAIKLEIFCKKIIPTSIINKGNGIPPSNCCRFTRETQFTQLLVGRQMEHSNR